MKTLKLLKSLWNLITLLVLTGLLTLPACRLLNPLGGQSSSVPQSTPFSFNFPIALKWQRSLDCTSVLQPAVWGGRTVGVPAHSGLCQSQFYTLDIQSGDILWQKEIDGMAMPGSWLSQEDKLIVGGDDRIQILDIRTGETEWSAPSLSQVFNVVYGEGKVFARVSRTTFRAYDLETGQVLWQSSIDGQGYIYYDAHNRLLIIPSASSWNVYWLDPVSGELLRTEKAIVEPPSLPQGKPIVENGRIYYGALVIGAATATPVCLHPKLDWELESGNRYYDLPLIDDVMYISTRWSVVAFDTVACQPQWEYQPQARPGRKRPVVVSNPAVLKGVVYAIFSDATLRAIDQQNGQEVGYWQADAVKYSFRHNRAIPGVVASNDMLVASFGNGHLYAFGP